MIYKQVDLTLLKPDSTIENFAKLCKDARKYSNEVRSICVLPDPEVIKFCFRKLYILPSDKLIFGAFREVLVS